MNPLPPAAPRIVGVFGAADAGCETPTTLKNVRLNETTMPANCLKKLCSD
jgi:hypothetical protein